MSNEERKKLVEYLRVSRREGRADMQGLTDGERKRLCEALRQKGLTGPVRVPMCAEAADEIERLAAEVEAMMDCDNQKLRQAEMRNLALSEEIEDQHKEIERLEKIVEYLSSEVAGPYGIAADVIKAAEEQTCS